MQGPQHIQQFVDEKLYPGKAASPELCGAPSTVTPDEAREIFAAMDLEGSGRVEFSMFVAACLAGQPVEKPLSTAAFEWFDRTSKGAILPADLEMLTGQVGLVGHLVFLGARRPPSSVPLLLTQARRSMLPFVTYNPLSLPRLR